jgi:hypothetical protein
MTTKTVLSPVRANTILYCRRWAATVQFYRDQLRLPVAFENDWFVEFQLNAAAYLSVADAARASIAAVDGQGITLAWQAHNLEEARTHLLEQGIAVAPLRRRWGAWVFYGPFGREPTCFSCWMNADRTPVRMFDARLDIQLTEE